MAKKNEKKRVEKNASEYYKLKTDAVDKLADSSSAPVVPDAEIKKYKSSAGKFRLPAWLKVVFIKFWFGGMVCFFFFWGLGIYLGNDLDLMVVIAIGLGLVIDLLENHMLRFLEPEKGDYNKYMMFYARKFWTLFANIAYAAVLLFLVMETYDKLNEMILFFQGIDPNEAESIPLGVEPLLFGLFIMGYDMLFIGIRNMFVKIFRDAEQKTLRQK